MKARDIQRKIVSNFKKMILEEKKMIKSQYSFHICPNNPSINGLTSEYSANLPYCLKCVYDKEKHEYVSTKQELLWIVDFLVRVFFSSPVSLCVDGFTEKKKIVFYL